MRSILLAVAAACLFVSCGNSGGGKDDGLKEKASALEKEVLEGHDVAMPKAMKIPDIQKEVNRLMDSVERLPAQAKEAAAPFKAKLEKLTEDLSYANMAMDKWMTEFGLDSFKSNLEQRIKYLSEEKLKVEKVKEAVLNSLAKADSVLKKKF